MKIDIVLSDGLEGLYIDNELKLQGEQLELTDILKLFGHETKIHHANQEWLEYKGCLPYNIDDCMMEY